MKKETILYGTAVLLLTNTIVKALSLVYRGILVRLIGAEGLGLTEMMMPFYSFLLVLASFGIPLAIANTVSAENSEKAKATIIKSGFFLLLFNSLFITLLIIVFFPLLKQFLFSDERIIWGFLALIPSVFVISVFSALRGYFQGSHLSSNLGKSQVVEQSVRILLGTVLTVFLLRKGVPLAMILVGISLSTLAAETVGGLYLLKKYLKIRPAEKGRFSVKTAKGLTRLGTPVTLSRLIITLTATVQATLIPGALMAKGASVSEAASFYGLFAGVALTILHLPAIITNALTTPLIPAIAAVNATGNRSLRNGKIVKSIRFTYLTALPLLAVLYYFSKEICTLLFASPEAGPILATLCLGAIFLYIQQPVIAILQGMNAFYRIFIHYCLADILYLAGLFFLGRSDYFSVSLVLLFFILNDVLVFYLNYYYMKKKTGAKIPLFSTYIGPLLGIIAGFILMQAAEKYLLPSNLPEMLSLTLSVSIFFCAYLFTLYISGILKSEELKAFSFRKNNH